MLDDIQAFLRHVRQYFYWYASGLLHFIVIGYAYYFGPYQVTLDSLETAKEYQTQAYIADADIRIQDMEEITELIERVNQSAKQQEPNPDANNKNIEKQSINDLAEDENAQLSLLDDQDGTSSTNNDGGTLDLASALSQATELSKNLELIEREQRAEKLSELTDISLEEALAKLDSEQLERLNTEDLNDLSEKEISDRIKDLHSDSITDLEDAYDRLKEQSESESSNLVGGFGAGEGNSSEGPNAGGNGSGSDTGHHDTAGFGSEGGSRSTDQTQQQRAELLTEIEEKLARAGSKRLRDSAGENSSRSFLVRYDDGPAKEARPIGVAPKAQFQVTGRTFGAGGSIADWVFLDTWYIAGPFENGEAAAPEYKVDLDAIYAGKHNELVRWQFYQSPNYPIIPPNSEDRATYYGYTELKFEEDTELWVSLGCDDDCALWLNGRQVWKSGRQFKLWYRQGGPSARKAEIARWDLTEAYEKLSFKKGVNKVLFRLDNYAAELFFSMVLTHKQGG